MDEDNEPRRKITHQINQDLSLLSIGELRERITLLREEIVRLETAIAAKQISQSVAEGVFKR